MCSGCYNAHSATAHPSATAWKGPCSDCMLCMVICSHVNRQEAAEQVHHTQNNVTPAFVSAARVPCSVKTGVVRRQKSATLPLRFHRALSAHAARVCVVHTHNNALRTPLDFPDGSRSHGSAWQLMSTGTDPFAQVVCPARHRV